MKRRLELGLQTSLRSLAILILGGLLVFLALRSPWRRDLSPRQWNSLSPRSDLVLDGLAAPLDITLFYPDREPERNRVAALMGAFAAGRPQISWELVDPGQHPRRALVAGVESPGSVLLEYEGRSEIVTQAPDDNGVYPLQESRVIQVLQDLTRGRQSRLQVLQGPGLRSLEQPEGYLALKRVLENEGYRVEPFDYFRSAAAAVPSATDLLIVPGPHRSLPQTLLEAVEAYLAGGGALLLFLDPAAEMADSSLAAGLEPLLGRYGLSVGPGFIVDMGEENIERGKGFEVPVIDRYANHPVTRGYLRQPVLTAFPLVRSFRSLEGGQAWPLALSSEESFEERGAFDGHVHYDPAEDLPGPFVIAAAVDSSSAGGGPLLVIGDSHFATADHIDWQGNSDFLLRCVAWLTGEARRLLADSPRQAATVLELDPASHRLFLAINLGLLPLIALAMWPLRLLWRRRKGASV